MKTINLTEEQILDLIYVLDMHLIDYEVGLDENLKEIRRILCNAKDAL